MGDTKGFVGADGNPVGTPGNSGSTDWQYIDPAGVDASGGTSDSGRAGKRRGRKPAAASGQEKEKVSSLRGLDIKEILLSIHSMLAIGLKTPALALEPAEADKLEDAIKRVWKHYPLNVSQKQVDIAFALTVAGEIYGTRIAAIIIERRATKQPRDENQTVFQFPVRQ